MKTTSKTDKEVIYELVKHAEPGTIFNYETLAWALSAGDDAIVPRSRVYQAITSANKVYQKENKRYLRVVRGEGYRVIPAEEHMIVSLKKKESANKLLEKGVTILRNTNLNELTDTQRKLHEGQLMVMSGLEQAIKHSEHRHNRQEEMILEMKKRIEQLESK